MEFLLESAPPLALRPLSPIQCFNAPIDGQILKRYELPPQLHSLQHTGTHTHPIKPEMQSSHEHVVRDEVQQLMLLQIVLCIPGLHGMQCTNYNSRRTEASSNTALYARKIDFVSPAPSACIEKNRESIMARCRPKMSRSMHSQISSQENAHNFDLPG